MRVLVGGCGGKGGWSERVALDTSAIATHLEFGDLISVARWYM